MSSISLFDTVSVVAVLLWLDPKILLCIPASAADAAAVNPKGIKALLVSSYVIGFLIT